MKADGPRLAVGDTRGDQYFATLWPRLRHARTPDARSSPPVTPFPSLYTIIEACYGKYQKWAPIWGTPTCTCWRFIIFDICWKKRMKVFNFWIIFMIFSLMTHEYSERFPWFPAQQSGLIAYSNFSEQVETTVDLLRRRRINRCYSLWLKYFDSA